MSIVEITGTGCPKAYQFPKLMSILVEYNTAKHDPTKLFKMDKHRGEPYITSVLDIPSSSEDSDDNTMNFFQTHSFNRIPHIGKKWKKFKPSICGPLDPSCGEVNVRVTGKYKLSDLRYGACTRLGLLETVDI